MDAAPYTQVYVQVQVQVHVQVRFVCSKSELQSLGTGKYTDSDGIVTLLRNGKGQMPKYQGAYSRTCVPTAA